MRLVLLLCVILLGAGESFSANGSKVMVQTMMGNVVEGELLSVREHSVVICLRPGVVPQVLVSDTTLVVEVMTDSITSFVVRDGIRHAKEGALVGTLAGGALFYFNTKNAQPPFLQWATPFAMMAGAVLGMGGGALVGLLITEDIVIVPFTPNDVEQVKAFARFSKGEPEYFGRVKVVRYR